ncbi:arsenite efflux ATP-binding protein ArsA [Quadrisphaera granulorum]|uniref:Arsenite efflux ATP-binding protein ArsA n=1 Tax=Quadrisphaera granulorum TaxID=317664 RepID=A0A316AT94_9ACTN|nr:ArsA-related P-loop ATPase [Quadrisphaera granulorum]PWJ53357.1 arsenite efflux ATP-binding protein ArsA [Quadrisphaera granulorum]SZE97031.1 arsenite efflux ATP-binding protein ArsA [Quadrisphaera granulorum]
MSTAWDVDALLDDPSVEVIVCAGSGGVGKTTTAAAIALRAAERGRRVAVLTVDPARRLAQALGTDGTPGDAADDAAEAGAEAGADEGDAPGPDEPRGVPGVDTRRGGSLDALVLDARRTLDGLVDAALPPARAAQVKANPVYVSLATSFSGTQEYMAMERLGQLRAGRDTAAGWDLVVVDTPPSRSALDFLDAPTRLASFLDGRFARLLMAPVRFAGSARTSTGLRAAGGRVVGALAGGVAAVMDRVLGGRLLRDVQALVEGLDEVFGGFRERAEVTSAALRDGRTAFVVVTAPEAEPLAEAVFLTERLRSAQLRPAAVVVNRAARAATGLDAATARQAAEALRTGTTGGAARGGKTSAAAEKAARVLDLQVELLERVERERRLVAERLADSGAPTALVPALDGDVADLDGLRAVGDALGRNR